MNYNFKVDSKNNVWPPPSTNVVIEANTHVIDVILKDSQRLDYYNNVIKIDLRQTSNLKWLRLNEVTANQNNQLAISSIALAIPPVERIQTRRRVKTLRREHTRIIARPNFRFQTSSSLNIQYNHNDKPGLAVHSFFFTFMSG